jgi:hypothetical protein
LSEVEQHGDELTCIGINLVGKVLDASATAQTNDRVAVAAWNNRST